MNASVAFKEHLMLEATDGQLALKEVYDDRTGSVAAPSAAGYNVETIRSLEGLRALHVPWNALAESQSSPLMRHEWYMAAAETLCKENDLFVIVIRHRGECVALAPMERSRIGPFSQLHILGAQTLGEPSGLLYRNGEALARLVEELAHVGCPVILERMHRDSPEAHFVQERDLGYRWISTSGTPWMPINSSWADYERSLSSHRRSTIRRFWKRAQSEGSTVLNVVSPSANEVDQILSEFELVENTGWKQHAGTSMAAVKGLRSFFTRLLECLAVAGLVRVAAFRFNGLPIAMILGTEYKRRLWILKTGFDQSYSRLSPGTILFHETIRYAFEHQLDAIEFLGSDEEWLHTWTDRVHAHLTIRTYPRGLWGALSLGRDAMGYFARHVARHVLQGERK